MTLPCHHTPRHFHQCTTMANKVERRPTKAKEDQHEPENTGCHVTTTTAVSASKTQGNEDQRGPMRPTKASSSRRGGSRCDTSRAPGMFSLFHCAYPLLIKITYRYLPTTTTQALPRHRQHHHHFHPVQAHTSQCRLMQAHESQRRPTQAHDSYAGPRQPTLAHDRQHRPMQANECPRKPT